MAPLSPLPPGLLGRHPTGHAHCRTTFTNSRHLQTRGSCFHSDCQASCGASSSRDGRGQRRQRRPAAGGTAGALACCPGPLAAIAACSYSVQQPSDGSPRPGASRAALATVGQPPSLRTCLAVGRAVHVGALCRLRHGAQRTPSRSGARLCRATPSSCSRRSLQRLQAMLQGQL